ncbi:hypothetical protein [Nocardia bovistercoris]|uniref:Secreted protein n=1 Tax=Nocardia bovistercoris TaxID=2785916 RepID=A0A931N2B3_9NOCA|nr:hypothetical protein [Nocardia bovistercoris]MBH0779315.1 hypothetical protein [Nocardia bovistercoris]
MVSRPNMKIASLTLLTVAGILSGLPAAIATPTTSPAPGTAECHYVGTVPGRHGTWYICFEPDQNGTIRTTYAPAPSAASPRPQRWP